MRYYDCLAALRTHLKFKVLNLKIRSVSMGGGVCVCMHTCFPDMFRGTGISIE